MTDKKDKPATGPAPEQLKIDGDWKDAVKGALQKKRPESGWPKPEKKKEKRQPE